MSATTMTPAEAKLRATVKHIQLATLAHYQWGDVEGLLPDLFILLDDDRYPDRFAINLLPVPLLEWARYADIMQLVEGIEFVGDIATHYGSLSRVVGTAMSIEGTQTPDNGDRPHSVRITCAVDRDGLVVTAIARQGQRTITIDASRDNPQVRACNTYRALTHLNGRLRGLCDAYELNLADQAEGTS
jgi:hypothetical protein